MPAIGAAVGAAVDPVGGRLVGGEAVDGGVPGSASSGGDVVDAGGTGVPVPAGTVVGAGGVSGRRGRASPLQAAARTAVATRAAAELGRIGFDRRVPPGL